MRFGSTVLFDRHPIVVDRLLARLIGLNHAIVLQQIHYWLHVNKLADRNYVDGRYWTYNSQEAWWKAHFQGLWSLDTQRKIFAELQEAGLLVVANHNKLHFDRTYWYSIDYDRLETLVSESTLSNLGSKHSSKAPLVFHRSSKVLFDEHPIVVSRELVLSFGLKPSIVLQQIHYWLNVNARENKNYRDGRYWTYNTIDQWWKDEFHILGSKPTVRRAFKTLEKAGVLLSGNYNKNKFDHTKWYSIDYNQLESVIGSSLENDHLDVIKTPKSGRSNFPHRRDRLTHIDGGKNDQVESLTEGKPIPETNQYITNIDIPNQTKTTDVLVGLGSTKDVSDSKRHGAIDSVTTSAGLPLPYSAFSDPRFLKYIRTMESVMGQTFTEEQKLAYAELWLKEIQEEEKQRRCDAFLRYKQMVSSTIRRPLNVAEEKHLERLWAQYDEDLLMKAEQELFGQLQVQVIPNPVAYIQGIVENWMKHGVVMTDITKKLLK